MSPISPSISVVVCTYNRVPYLRKALRSLAAQSLPRDRFEVLVIDNGSDHETRKLVDDEFAQLHNTRYVREPALGLSRARNAGIRNARGEYLAYLDDDAVADPDWLLSILRVFQEADPMPGCVGGPVLPIWERPLPPWWPPQLLSGLTIIDWSRQPCLLRRNQFLAGTNMSFPRGVLDAVGGFLPRLDRRGANLLSNGDTHMQREVEHHGYGCYYHPDVRVRHHVPAERLTKKWFLRRGYWQGVSNAVLRVHDDACSSRSRRAAAQAALQLVKSPRRHARLFLLPSDEPRTMRDKYMAWREIGWILGLLGLVK